MLSGTTGKSGTTIIFHRSPHHDCLSVQTHLPGPGLVEPAILNFGWIMDIVCRPVCSSTERVEPGDGVN